MSALPVKADMLSVSIDVRFVPITDIRASAQFFWVACHHLSARLDGAEPVPPGGPVELVMLNAPAGELGKAGPLGCHRQGSHAVSLRLPANSIKELYAGYRADDGAVDELVGQAQKLHPQLSTFECHLDDSTLSVGFNNMFLLQRRSERNTTEGSIHGNANNAPKTPMG